MARKKEASTIGFGPIIEGASGNLLITLNPLFTGQVGPNRDAEGLGFEYGWRGEYDFAKHGGAGVECSWRSKISQMPVLQRPEPQHRSDLVLESGRGGGTRARRTNPREGDDEKVAGPPKMELSLNVGVQFGLTDATSDLQLKFQTSLSF